MECEVGKWLHDTRKELIEKMRITESIHGSYGNKTAMAWVSIFRALLLNGKEHFDVCSACRENSQREEMEKWVIFPK